MTRYLLGLMLVLTFGLAACDVDSTDGVDTTADPVIEQPLTPEATPPVDTPSSLDGASDALNDAADGVNNAVDSAADSVNSAVDSAVDGAGNAVDSAADSASSAVDSAADSVDNAAESASDTIDSVTDSVNDSVNESVDNLGDEPLGPLVPDSEPLPGNASPATPGN